MLRRLASTVADVAPRRRFCSPFGGPSVRERPLRQHRCVSTLVLCTVAQPRSLFARSCGCCAPGGPVSVHRAWSPADYTQLATTQPLSTAYTGVRKRVQLQPSDGGQPPVSAASKLHGAETLQLTGARSSVRAPRCRHPATAPAKTHRLDGTTRTRRLHGRRTPHQSTDGATISGGSTMPKITAPAHRTSGVSRSRSTTWRHRRLQPSTLRHDSSADHSLAYALGRNC